MAGQGKNKPRTQPPNSSRVHLERNLRVFAKHTPADAYVLDAGAGTSPYRKLFEHARYESADFAQVNKQYGQLDYVCDLTDIPVEDARFDRVIFNQVLEHIPEPERVLAELNRVLKPGGKLFCSAPLFYAEHEQPYDFYRFTRFALRRLFEQAGFRVIRLNWMEGYFGTIAYQFNFMYKSLPEDLAEVREITSGKRLVYLAPLLLGTRWLAGKLGGAFSDADTRWKYTKRGMPKNYIIVVSKPGGGSD